MRAAPSIAKILARTITGVLASIPGLLASPTPSGASYLFDPDSVCAPTDTVCVIDRAWTVLRDEPLDFGNRRVVVRGGGHLEGELELRCGSFEVDVDGEWMKVVQAVHDAPGVSVSARRGCSGDPAVPCLADDECGKSGLGSCSVGNASIGIFGSASAAGSTVRLRAADNVTVGGSVDVSGPPAEDYPDYNGGSLDIFAVAGSVLLLAPIHGNAGADTGYGGYGFSGDIYVAAGKDISIWQPVHLVGGGGSLNLDAGRDIRIRAPILGYGVEGNASWGAGIEAEAGRDILVEPPPARKTLPLRLHGGFYVDEDGGNAGSGGNGDLTAGRDIVIAQGVRIGADSGRSYGYVDDSPYGGVWLLHAGEDIRFDGRLSVRGRGIFGESEGVEFSAGSTLSIGPTAKINLRSDYIGEISLESRNRGDVTIEGHVDARAHDSLDSDGYYSGSGGSLFLDGGDVDFRGVFETGGGSASGDVHLQACRLHLGGSSRIDAGMGAQDDYSGGFEIEIGESMVADPGSVLASHAKANPSIVYRDAAKPPQLQGTVPPNLALKVSPSLGGCPVCGNAELDEGEACDDGNLDDGDGCSQTCAVEPEGAGPKKSGGPLRPDGYNPPP